MILGLGLLTFLTPFATGKSFNRVFFVVLCEVVLKFMHLSPGFCENFNQAVDTLRTVVENDVCHSHFSS